MTTPQDGLSLEEEFFPTDSARMLRWCPWLRLLRAFRIAVDYRLLLISALALTLWTLGDLGIQRLGQTSGIEMKVANHGFLSWPWERAEADAGVNRVSFFEGLDHPSEILTRAFSQGKQILSPLKRLLSLGNFLVEPPKTWGSYFLHWLLLLWGLLVASISGGVICRVAAIESTVLGASIFQACRYSVGHTLSFLGAPLTAFVGFAGLWSLLTLGGWLGRVPYFGDVLLGLFWFLALILGVLLALLVLGVAVGWPLMVAAVSVEDSDGFDGLSRSYTYVFNRPWYLLVLTLGAMAYGSALLFFVEGVLDQAMVLASHSTGIRPPDTLPAEAGLRPTLGFRDQLLVFWGRVAATVPAAFVYSLFWTFVTLIYVLLRRREDGTPVTEVAGLADQVVRNGPPLIGIPAAEQREKRFRVEPGA